MTDQADHDAAIRVITMLGMRKRHRAGCLNKKQPSRPHAKTARLSLSFAVLLVKVTIQSAHGYVAAANLDGFESDPRAAWMLSP
jgi:hypothetical protein